MEKAKSVERGYKRTLYVMSLICNELKYHKIKPVIIGGAAVEFYTRDWYSTFDIDLAVNPGDSEIVDNVLQDLGFERTGRAWSRVDIGIEIEMPGRLKSLREDKIIEADTGVGKAYIAGVDDIIVDRILAAKHWDSTQDEEQVIEIAIGNYNDIEWGYIEEKCKEDQAEDKFVEIKKRIEDEKGKVGGLGKEG
ncbi:MAG: hypothetical protein ACE5PM_06840 [Candidatus Hydrothermarchaeales archaeon]